MTDFPPEIIDLLERLTFYNTVPANQKICFHSKTMVWKGFGWGSVVRRCYGENSTDLIEKTHKLLDDSGRVIDLKNYQQFKPYIHKQLDLMRGSLTRLKGTYTDDPDIKSKLDVCFSKLYQICSKITEEDRKKITELDQMVTAFNPGSWQNVSPGSFGKIIFPPPPPPYYKEETQIPEEQPQDDISSGTSHSQINFPYIKSDPIKITSDKKKC